MTWDFFELQVRAFAVVLCSAANPPPNLEEAQAWYLGAVKHIAE